MLTVTTHVREPDGTVHLTLRLEGPLLDDPFVVLADVGGTVTVDGDDALIGWEWPAAMVPPDVVTVCAAHVREAFTAWAARWAEPQGLVLTDAGTVV